MNKFQRLMKQNKGSIVRLAHTLGTSRQNVWNAVMRGIKTYNKRELYTQAFNETFKTCFTTEELFGGIATTVEIDKERLKTLLEKERLFEELKKKFTF